MKTVSIIIPVYNEGSTIGELFAKVVNANTCGLAKEIIIVDDCSTDCTGKMIELFLESPSYVLKKIYLNSNAGKTAAVVQGVKESTGDIVIIQDADLEYDPTDFPLLIVPFLEHQADVVYGSRFVGSETRRILYFWHAVGNIMLTLISNMCSNLNLTDMETGYKAFKGNIIRKIVPYIRSKRFGFEPEITARIAKYPNLRMFEVGIKYWGRTYQEGKKIGWKDGVRALGQIIKYNLLTKVEHSL